MRGEEGGQEQPRALGRSRWSFSSCCSAAAPRNRVTAEPGLQQVACRQWGQKKFWRALVGQLAKLTGTESTERPSASPDVGRFVPEFTKRGGGLCCSTLTPHSPHLPALCRSPVEIDWRGPESVGLFLSCRACCRSLRGFGSFRAQHTSLPGNMRLISPVIFKSRRPGDNPLDRPEVCQPGEFGSAETCRVAVHCPVGGQHASDLQSY